METGTVSK